MTSKYSLSFSLNVLNLLGIGLYSNLPAILSELVANSWDAGATRVDITLEPDRIVISDNGRGMSSDEINDRFLRIGYQKRRDELALALLNDQRHVMGRKGIGKLTVFSIASRVEIQTVRSGEKSGLVMQLSEIEDAIANDSSEYYPTELTHEQLSIAYGTQIELLHLRQPLGESEPQLRTELARRFTVIGSERQFEVVINGDPISARDRDYYDKIQFLWYLGPHSKNYVHRCTNCLQAFEASDTLNILPTYRVRGWLATVTIPSAIRDHHHTISVFAHGKLVQEDILAGIREARYVKQYLIGEIDADFLDDDDDRDIVTSDRQRLNQSDPRYRWLLDYVRKRVKEIASQWSSLRKELKEAKKQQDGENTSDFTSDDATLLEQNPVDSSAITTQIPGVVLPLAPVLLSTDEHGSEPNLPNSVANPRPKAPSPPAREAHAIFQSIVTKIIESDLEDGLKNVIWSDIEQARLSYNATAYKACVVMLGAALEGMMLGVLRKSAVIEVMIADPDFPPALMRKLGGFQNPNYSDRSILANALVELLDFETMKTLIERYFPKTRSLGIGDIQRFRNAVHPGRCLSDPELYSFQPARALKDVAAMDLLSGVLLTEKS